MKKIIKNFILKSRILNIISILFYFFRIFKIKPNKIICLSFNGKFYSDSPKYIADKIIELFPGKYDIIWLVNNVDNNNIKGIRQVKINSFKYFFELATAKFWISNGRFEFFVKKRKGQYYIQTWHGCIALKKIEYAAFDKLTEHYKIVMKNDTKMIDLMISNSDFCNNMYRNDFKYNGEIIKIGTPRNDLFFDKNKIEKLRKNINVNGEKILLYAPTFRNSYDLNPYDIDFNNIRIELERKTNNKWIVFVKFHPGMNNYSDFVKFDENIIDMSKYNDIQELIAISDLLITDYSSTMFEAMIADKNVILYVKDYVEYVKERGYYFKFEELPFEKATNNNELINIISNFELNYDDKYRKFKDNIGLIENGESSEIIAKKIDEIYAKYNDRKKNNG